VADDPGGLGTPSATACRAQRLVRAALRAVDLLVTPTVPFDPPPARGPFPRRNGGPQASRRGVASFTIPFNLSWHPGATMRVGLSRAKLPIGMQIVGPRHRDDLVLQPARLESERPWHPVWPLRW